MDPPPTNAAPSEPLPLNYQAPGASPRPHTPPAHPIVAVAGAAAYLILTGFFTLASAALYVSSLRRPGDSAMPMLVITIPAALFCAWRASDAILDLFRRRRDPKRSNPLT